MTTYSQSAPLRRQDLETLLGIGPIYSTFAAHKKQMRYFYRNHVATIDCHKVVVPFDQWLGEEEAACRKVFL